jgi:hypothetical protein
MKLTGFDVSIFLAFLAAVILLSMVKSRREKNSKKYGVKPQHSTFDAKGGQSGAMLFAVKCVLLNVEV